MYPPEPPETPPNRSETPRPSRPFNSQATERDGPVYDRCRLCNDCALRYELALAEGDVKTIEDFVLAH